MKTTVVERESGYTIVALFIAPIVAAFGMAVSGFAQSGGLVKSAVLVLGWTFVFYSFALAATLLIGLPSFLALRKFGLVRWWSSIASGFFVGSTALFAVDPGAPSSRPSDFALWGGIGALSAFVFWMIRLYGQRRLTPDV